MPKTYPARSEEHIRYGESGDQERRKNEDDEFHIVIQGWYCYCYTRKKSWRHKLDKRTALAVDSTD